MFPELFRIGRVTVYTYGFMIAIGILAALYMAVVRGRHTGEDKETIFDIAFYAVVGGIIGAKLLYLITQLDVLIKTPGEIIDMITSGFVVYGAIIGGIISAFIYCRLKKLDFLKYFDLLVPSVALAQGFGRIGCFSAGCCYGRETDSAIGVIFKKSLYAPNGVRLVPTQLISSAGDFIICLILVLFASRSRKRGSTAGLYIVLYSVGRFLIEFLRDDPRGSIGILSTSQFICIFMFIGGVMLLWTRSSKAK